MRFVNRQNKQIYPKIIQRGHALICVIASHQLGYPSSGVGLEPTALFTREHGFCAMAEESNPTSCPLSDLTFPRPSELVPIQPLGRCGCLFPCCDYSILQGSANVNTFLKKNKRKKHPKTLDKCGRWCYTIFNKSKGDDSNV